MDFSKLKLEVYDFLGVLLPGLFALALASFIFSGAASVVRLFHDISGPNLTLLLFCGFAAGQLVQEAADRSLKLLKGPRFFKASRDAFWKTAAADEIRQKIKQQSNLDIASVDAAFDYCLTCIGSKFVKRDTFLAISDLARSMWLLSIVCIVPTILSAIHKVSTRARLIGGGEGLIFTILAAYLAWSRMVRFRQLSDVTVFNVFLASSSTSSSDKPEPGVNE